MSALQSLILNTMDKTAYIRLDIDYLQVISNLQELKLLWNENVQTIMKE